MSYRLYFLDQHGHIRSAVDIECQDDAEALRAVELHRDGQAIELWNGERFVKSFSNLKADA